MKKITKISGLLSSATGVLLGAAHAQTGSDEWNVDSALLIYSEKDRVTAIEPVVNLNKDLNESDNLNVKLTLDSLTGASATGAVPSTRAQTYTRPSGNGSYTIAPNQTPLDDTFHDTRAQLNANWDKTMDADNRRNLGVHLSREFDFTSLGASASWTREMNQNNTALTGAVNLELDSISPIGGIPVARSVHAAGQPLVGQPINRASSDENRTIVDLLFGVTQIIDSSSLFQVNLSLSQADGYMTDPFKLVSVVQSAAGANQGEPVQIIYEERPDSRTKTSVFGKYKKQLANNDIFTASLRLMTDDWGVDSETLDLSYRLRFISGYYLQPHLRLYHQSAADFYRYFLLDSEATPRYVSADYRLGEMDATTFGIKVGKSDSYGNDWSVRIEQYLQSGESSPSQAIGQLTGQDLYPDVEAVIVQASYSFKW